MKKYSSVAVTVQQDAMQIVSVPELAPSCGYENLVTDMYVFLHYSLAYPSPI